MDSDAVSAAMVGRFINSQRLGRALFVNAVSKIRALKLPANFSGQGALCASADGECSGRTGNQASSPGSRQKGNQSGGRWDFSRWRLGEGAVAKWHVWLDLVGLAVSCWAPLNLKL